MQQPIQISYLHCSNPKCKWKIRYKGDLNSHPDFCPKCGWLAFYHCPNCAPTFSLNRRFGQRPEATLFEDGTCRLCRAQSKPHTLKYLRQLLEELSSASGFIAKDNLVYKKELDTSPDSLPYRMEEKLYSADEQKMKILHFYREDSALVLEQVTLFLRKTLDLPNQQKDIPSDV